MDKFNLIVGLIGLITGPVGLFYSFKSFGQAKEAKDEASEAKTAAKEAGQLAGKIIKRQSIALEISEIYHMCEIKPGINFFEAHEKFADIYSKVRNIIGLFGRNSDPNLQDIFQRIENSLGEIKAVLLNINPTVSTNTDKSKNKKTDKEFIYFLLANPFASLMGDLTELKGILESQLIENNITK